MDPNLKRVLALSKKSFKEEEEKRKSEAARLAREVAELEARRQGELATRKAELAELHAIEEACKLSLQTVEEKESATELQISDAWPWDERAALVKYLNTVNWDESFVRKGVGAGLKNLGNSCFMNATLQCLAYTPVIAQLLAEAKHHSVCGKKLSGDFCALCSLEVLIPMLHQYSPRQALQPKKLFQCIPRINDYLRAGCQEDADEYLVSLMDKLEIAYDDTIPKDLPKERRVAGNPMKSLFEGAQKTVITCGGCKTRSVTVEPFCRLSLSAEHVDSVEEGLMKFSRDEVMQGEERYFCNKCNKKKLAGKKMGLCKLPPVLVMHLKRFCVGADYQMRKLNHFIEFPTRLDFSGGVDVEGKKEKSPYVHEEDHEAVGSGDSEYELYAVLVHSGPQLGFGHYYALVKAPNGQWCKMNDSEVLQVSLTRVLKEQAYILFYRRTTHISMVNKLEALTVRRGMKLPECVMQSIVKQRSLSDGVVHCEELEEGNTGVDHDVVHDDYIKQKCSVADGSVDSPLVTIPGMKTVTESFMLDSSSSASSNGNAVDNGSGAVGGIVAKGKADGVSVKKMKQTDYERIYWPERENN